MQAGSILCWVTAGLIMVQVKKGDIMCMKDKENCYNECIQIGHRGYMVRKSTFPRNPQCTLPVATKDRFVEGGHQLIHDQMAKDIWDSEDIIQEICDKQKNETEVSLHVGAAGVAVSIL